MIVACSHLSPYVALSGLSGVGRCLVPRALPWAIIFEPFGLELERFGLELEHFGLELERFGLE